MDPLAFIAAAAVVFAVVHLLVLGYLYRQRRSADIGGALETAIEDSEETEQTHSRNVEVDISKGEMSCRVCGTKNDTFYRFCKGCVSELSAQTLADDSQELSRSPGN